MDKLTIEEKAKRYDEAIERANELNYVSDKDSLQCKTVEHIFPELKESEDENIRKFLINEVLGHLVMLDLEGDRIVNNVKNDLWKKALSWLEKQGNINKIITRNEFTHGVLRGAAINLINWIDSNAAKNNMCLSNMECKDIEDALVSCNWDKIYAYMKKKFEKQGEKSQGKSALETINEEKINNQNCVKPADKIEPKFKVGDVMRTKQEAADNITSGMPVVVSIDEEYYHCTNELIAIKDQDDYEYPPMNRRQKPAWSEEDEDEKIITEIINDIECAKAVNYHAPKENYEFRQNWLKSLKSRVKPQPKQEWSKEDEEMFVTISDLLWEGYKVSDGKPTWEEIRDWFRTNYPQKQWKPSEEHIHWLIWVINRMPDTEKANEAEVVLGELLEQLKKL